MKKITIALTALLALFPLCACGKNEQEIEQEQTPPYIETPAKEELPPKTFEEPPKPSQPLPEDTPKEDFQKELPSKPAAEVIEKTVYVRILTDGLNIREGAGTNFPSLGKAEKGTLLYFAGKTGNWYETNYLGKRAYVSADKRYTCTEEMETREKNIEDVIFEGCKLLGTPYVYGATRLHDGKGNFLKGFSRDKFDCSSLMQYIFYKGAGILLDVTTRTQIKQGKSVGEGDLKRGDLLFFTNDTRVNKSGIERVGHVALYLGGNYILHTASDTAKIEQISQKRWNYFLEAKRMY